MSKGISPLTAAVLLIALTMLIVYIVGSWITGEYKKGRMEDKPKPVEQVLYEPILVKLETPNSVSLEEYCWSEEIDIEDDWTEEGWILFGNQIECYRDNTQIVMCPEVYDIYIPEMRKCFSELNYTTGRETDYCCRIRTTEIPINRTIYWKNNIVSFEQFTEWFYPKYYDNYEPYYIKQDLESMFRHYGRLS